MRTARYAHIFLCVYVMVDMEKHEGGGKGCGGGVKLVMRSLENRLHNGVMEGGGLLPHTPPPCLKRNKGAISIPYLMAGPREKPYSRIQTETKPPGGQLQLPVGAA